MTGPSETVAEEARGLQAECVPVTDALRTLYPTIRADVIAEVAEALWNAGDLRGDGHWAHRAANFIEREFGS